MSKCIYCDVPSSQSKEIKIFHNLPIDLETSSGGIEEIYIAATGNDREHWISIYTSEDADYLNINYCPICGKTDTLRIMEGDRVWIECMEGEDCEYTMDCMWGVDGWCDRPKDTQCKMHEEFEKYYEARKKQTRKVRS